MEAKLEAERRDDNGKGVARKLRAAGRVPAVFYGHEQETVALSVDAREMFHLLHSAGGSNVLLDLMVDGKPHLAMPREIQRDHIHNTLIHVDFLAVSRTQKIAVDVPVVEVGDAAGVKEGGVVEHHLRDLHIESLPQDVPEHIEVDITELNIGDMIHVRDVVVPEGVTILTNPDDAVLSVITPAALRVEAELGLPGEEVARGRGGAARRGRGSARRGGRGRSRCRGGRRELVHGPVARRRPGKPRRSIRQDPSQRRRHGGRPVGERGGRAVPQGAVRPRGDRRGRDRRPEGVAGQVAPLHERIRTVVRLDREEARRHARSRDRGARRDRPAVRRVEGEDRRLDRGTQRVEVAAAVAADAGLPPGAGRRRAARRAGRIPPTTSCSRSPSARRPTSRS